MDRFDMATKEEIRRKYAAGAKAHDLRAEYQTRLEVIRDIIEEGGGTLTRDRYIRNNYMLPDDTIVEIAERHMRGEPMTKLAAEYGVSRQTIALYIRRAPDILKAREHEALVEA